ncbi:hypothetical protein BJ138DRAFT_1235411 [Hygrophoropsis aurantiaca]|uniref:Uncharacterized protein n=1 Tax=Hygrophoropsis aurantiaca TaxID=72124 RepID=A0ACB7ZUK6_9AGAM|nr:hypothetical protein BJ138DRAFT_1235411 [Hygrophoropsis aurantiaca]
MSSQPLRRSPRTSPKSDAMDVSDHELPQKKGTCKWTEEDEAALIRYVAENKPKGGDGLNFPKSFFNAAADAMPKPTIGLVKTGPACKTKFTKLRATYNIVLQITQRSGGSYSLERGADIQAADEVAWKSFVQKKATLSTSAEFQKFRNKGWIHFRAMQELIPSKGKGSNVHRAGFSTPPSQNDPNNTGGVESLNPEDATDEISNMLDQSQITPSNIPKSSTPASSSLASGSKRKFDDADNDSLSGMRPPSSVGTDASSTTKHRRLTAPVALNRVGDELTQLNVNFQRNTDTMSVNMNNLFQSIPARQTNTSASSRRNDAVQLLIEKEKPWVGDDKTLALMDLIKNDVGHADMYMTMRDDDNQGLRHKWIQRRLAELGFTVKLPEDSEPQAES